MNTFISHKADTKLKLQIYKFHFFQTRCSCIIWTLKNFTTNLQDRPYQVRPQTLKQRCTCISAVSRERFRFTWPPSLHKSKIESPSLKQEKETEPAEDGEAGEEQSGWKESWEGKVWSRADLAGGGDQDEIILVVNGVIGIHASQRLRSQ